jgi:hypothetical protein
LLCFSSSVLGSFLLVFLSLFSCSVFLLCFCLPPLGSALFFFPVLPPVLFFVFFFFVLFVCPSPDLSVFFSFPPLFFVL